MTREQAQVVVAYDFSRSSESALRRAIALAKRAPFHVLHVVCAIDPHDPNPSVPHRGRVDYRYAEQVQAAMSDAIAQEVRAAEVTVSVQFFVHARIGKPADEILSLAREVGADLIIIGSKGLTGIDRLVLGSVSERVVRESGCTVEVARPKRYENVELLQVREAEATHHYVPPHRYTYDQQTASLRPSEWPLY
jgi:nucleotide-binding universal stress UspA family protein